VKRHGGLFHEECIEQGWVKPDVYAAEPRERKLTRPELAEAHRLWVKHRDIREGRVKAA
jgi:hypothetical protein